MHFSPIDEVYPKTSKKLEVIHVGEKSRIQKGGNGGKDVGQHDDGQQGQVG
jgi:hypothetical protein